MEEFFLKAAALLEEMMYLFTLLIVVLGINAFANLMRAWRSKQEPHPASMRELEARVAELEEHVERQELHLLDRPDAEWLGPDGDGAEASLVERRGHKN